MIKNALNLTGAYGRPASLQDWKDGKDFRIIGGPYCSIRDVARMKADGYTHVRLFGLHILTYIEVAL